MALTKISASVIAANAIVAAGVAENSISTSEIATDGVGTLQISDGAVTSGKLETNIDIAGTLDVTGVLTADSNVVIAGNLTVNGATVTNSSTNTTIADALIELGTGTTGSPANDAGIVIERGDSDNAFIGWDESADTFILGTGSFTGASTGNLTISTAPLSVGTLTASGITYPTSDGSSGQVLKTDGSGNLTFDAQTAVVDNFTATGDGSTTDFDTGINPGDEVNTWVFIDGVYQQKGEYSYSGSTISFSTAPDSGATIDVTTGTVGGFASADSVLGVYETTTTNTDTYTTGISASNENNTWVFVGGVYQPKDSYTFSSGTLTFDANTPTGQKLSVTATKSLSAGSVETNSITANAVTSAKIASNSILSRHIANNSIVGADISATTQITASTFTGALTGDVTGNVVGNLTGTVQTAAQTNITSVGTLSALTVSGTVTADGLSLSGEGLAYFALGTYSSSASNNAGLRIRSSTGAASGNWAGMTFQATSGDSTGTYWQQGITTGSGSYASDFVVKSSTGASSMAERIRIDSAGKVGIGSTNPSYNLDIWGATDPAVRILNTGTGSSDDSILRLQIAGSTARNFIYFGDIDDSDVGKIEYNHSDNSMRFTTTTAEAFRVHSSGAISVGSDEVYGLFNVEGSINFNGNIRPNANTNGGSESAPTICVGYDNDTGFFHPTSNTIGFTTLGSERMRIDSSGRVGIGAAPQTAPYYNNDDPVLTVHKASGNAILPIVAAANTSSAILHLNQSGNRYWRISAINADAALTFGGKQPGSGAGETENVRISTKGLSLGDTDGDYVSRNNTGGLHVKRGGILMNGPPGDANMSSAAADNCWTYHGQGGRGGSFTSLTISVPNCNNGASGVGYGGFSLEFYIAGYNAKFFSGHFSGYVNNSITLSKRAFWDSSGSGTLSSGSVGSQGFYLTIGFPSMTHPTCKFVINKGGHGVSGPYTNMSGVSVTWA